MRQRGNACDPERAFCRPRRHSMEISSSKVFRIAPEIGASNVDRNHPGSDPPKGGTTMLLKTLAGLTAGLLLTASIGAAHADSTGLTIYHSWSTPSEMAALNVLKTNLATSNIGWTEIAIPHDTGANVSLTN